MAGSDRCPSGHTGLLMAPSVHDLSEQLTWHWAAQIRPRLVGLEDDEYFWEPAPGAWSVRPGPDGSFAPDWEWPPPEPAPVTTIAWRLGHIWMILAQRADYHFGDRTLTMDKLTWPGSAETALAALDRGYETWTAGVANLSEEQAERHSDGPPGTLDGQFPLWSVVLHVNREVIHHGAEVALLRDLYRAQRD